MPLPHLRRVGSELRPPSRALHFFLAGPRQDGSDHNCRVQQCLALATEFAFRRDWSSISITSPERASPSSVPISTHEVSRGVTLIEEKSQAVWSAPT